MGSFLRGQAGQALTWVFQMGVKMQQNRAGKVTEVHHHPHSHTDESHRPNVSKGSQTRGNTHCMISVM